MRTWCVGTKGIKSALAIAQEMLVRVRLQREYNECRGTSSLTQFAALREGARSPQGRAESSLVDLLRSRVRPNQLHSLDAQARGLGRNRKGNFAMRNYA